ncbi:sulfite reductase subunit alpha [Cerasicoccus fimbriatus]|uniref:sulfite reductase subunit alpha n=1 Tax=Cerasicoccus fimbriatus TaxID=3014554 RepID=UPI0022B5C53D|nr:sulfite reductase subunit alpha [Cerasicoccus sp. TK19100]
MSSTSPQALVPFLPENAPFTAEQRAYLNGLLAGIFSGSPASLPMPAESAAPARPLTILFGSQTGNAETLAKQTAKKAKAQGFAAEVFDMEAYPTERLPNEQNLLIITSTYGEGDPPDNAEELHSFLLSDEAPKLEKVRYSVLGLGDSNYPDFNQCAKEFDSRLAELGAERLHNGVYCDVEFDDDFEEWLSGTLSKANEGEAPATNSAMQSLPAPTEAEEAPGYSRKNPFAGKLLKNHVLNKEGSAKEIRHVEICLNGSGLEYEAGDALGVVPVNCKALVEEILSATGFTGEEPVANPEGGEVALYEALSKFYDITNISKIFLANLAPFANHQKLNELLADGSGDIDDYMAGRQIIDALIEFPGQWETTMDFIGMFKKLAPRLYSISSSPKAHPGHVHLTVGAVRYETHGRSRKGVASTFLADLEEGGEVRVYVQPNKHFKPPVNPNTPMIMVGPGTGIAPFRAFLEERMSTKAPGKNWLFFGDQKSEFDFIYEPQLKLMQGENCLTRLDLAFSRDTAEKVYVQHRMLEQAEELFAWLEEGAHFYVCGDASRMAKDVDAALHEVIAKAGGMSYEDATAYVEKLRKEKRYVRDVY